MLLATGSLSSAVAETPAKEHLKVMQIHYAPLSNASAEYIEVMNTSFTETIDLTGVQFTSGIEFDFTGADITSLAPGRRVVLVKDADVFDATYTRFFLPMIAGEFANGSSLDDQGGLLVLKDSAGETIFSAHYRANAQWPHKTGHPITPGQQVYMRLKVTE